MMKAVAGAIDTRANGKAPRRAQLSSPWVLSGGALLALSLRLATFDRVPLLIGPCPGVDGPCPRSTTAAYDENRSTMSVSSTATFARCYSLAHIRP